MKLCVKVNFFSFLLHSPIPHQPCVPTKETFSPEHVSCDPDPLEGLQQPCDEDKAELQHMEESSIRLLQRNNHLEAVAEDSGATDVRFFLGDSEDDPESRTDSAGELQRRCQIQTPVEVHSTAGTGFEVNCGGNSESEGRSFTTLGEEEQTVANPDTEEQPDQRKSSEDATIGNNSETEKCVNSVAISDFKDSDAGTQEGVVEDVCSDKQVLENDVRVNGLRDVADVGRLEEVANSDGQNEPANEESDESESKDETPRESEIQETRNADSVPLVESGDDDRQVDQRQVEQEVDLVGNKGESDEDGHSLPSSNESIVKVSDEESICDEAEDLMDENGYMKTTRGEEVTLWSEVDDSSRNILDMHMNGRPEEKEDISHQEGVIQAKDLQYVAEINELSDSLDIDSTVITGDLTENSDFSILETSCSPGLADSKSTQ